jgi:hypothetical protein
VKIIKINFTKLKKKLNKKTEFFFFFFSKKIIVADRHPKVGHDVLIGCNTTVLGNISIGCCSKIGSGSIVLKTLPPGVTAVGNPAKIVGRSLCPSAVQYYYHSEQLIHFQFILLLILFFPGFVLI